VNDPEGGRPRTLAIDIGGSGCKALVLDAQGNAITKKKRIPTPEVPSPKAVMPVLEELARHHGAFERISVGFPGVVVDGEIKTAVNLHPDWIGFPLAKELNKATGRPARVANDADIQGMGVIEGKGVELVLTLGTGIGASLFTDGKLVPNLELGHHPFRRNHTYEECLGEAAMLRHGPKRWNKRLAEAIALLERIFNYRMLYLGGGNAKKITFDLPNKVTQTKNVAGLLGGIALWRD